MALTLKSNGTGAANLIQAQWFNDFMNLFTGVMADQPVTFNNMLLIKQTTYTTPTAPTLALAAGTGAGIGAYTYAVTFGMGNSQSLPGATATITTTTGNQNVNLSALPLGPAGTTYRAIYRSKVGTTTPLYLVHTISDNVTTTYADSTPDSSLTSVAASHDTFGGQFLLQNQAGTNKAQIRADGSVLFDGGGITTDGTGILTLLGLINNATPIVLSGTTAGTASLYTVVLGPLKIYYLIYLGYENTTATEQKITLPQAFTTRAGFLALGGNPITHFFAGGSQLSGKCAIIQTLPSGSNAGTPNSQSGVNGFSTGEITAAFDTIGLSVSDSQALSGGIFFFGV